MFNKIFGGNSRNSSASAEPELPAVYSEPFFYGRITRTEAENILRINGLEEGLYLLRESITPMGNFSISVVHDNSVLHYSIEKMIDGKYAITEKVPFNDPVSLISHYQKTGLGFVSPPNIALQRVQSQEAIAFRGVSYRELHAQMKLCARRMNANMAIAFGRMLESLLMQTVQTMHINMPWFHGDINREEGNRRLQADGHQNGKFLIRSHSEKNSFALTLSHDHSLRQYYITVTDNETYSLENGHRFKALIILVDHYHNKRDGLSCKLDCPVPNPKTTVTAWNNYQHLTSIFIQQKGEKVKMCPVLPKRPAPPPPSPTSVQPSASGGAEGGHPDIPVKSIPDEFNDGCIYEDAGMLENVYIDIRSDVMSMDLREDQICLEEKELGSGQFGDVKRGWCRIGKTKVPVAVKTLKGGGNVGAEEDFLKKEEEILAEASVMKHLDHPNIVRMIGVCKGESIMLVMELAERGPLKKYLEPHRKKHTRMKTWHLLELMVQICEGMVYLESKDIVHRDLATRNVLLMTEHFAKISDFGLSRIVDDQSDYYTAHCPGKWPLMWYAPECMYFHKFDSKSDVWSFGVTMWEIMAYGAKPYHKMLPNQLLPFLEKNQRLAQPENCPEDIYSIMMKCWEFNKEKRPNFSQLLDLLKPLFRNYYTRDV